MKPIFDTVEDFVNLADDETLISEILGLKEYISELLKDRDHWRESYGSLSKTCDRSYRQLKEDYEQLKDDYECLKSDNEFVTETSKQLGELVDSGDVTVERGKRYGDFADNASFTQKAEALLKELPNYGSATVLHHEAAHMILQKLSRAFSGDPFYSDNWVDIGGYAKLVVKFNEEIDND